jgi:hypothetical protein
MGGVGEDGTFHNTKLLHLTFYVKPVKYQGAVSPLRVVRGAPIHRLA